jgi:hypothetical protein
MSSQTVPMKAVGDLVQNVVKGSSKRVDLLVTGTIGKLIDLLKRRLPYVIGIFAAYMLWKYYQGKKFKLYFKANKHNLNIVNELVLPMLERYKPAIHVPKIVRMLMNAFDVSVYNISTTPSNIMREKRWACLMEKKSAWTGFLKTTESWLLRRPSCC